MCEGALLSFTVLAVLSRADHILSKEWPFKRGTTAEGPL